MKSHVVTTASHAKLKFVNGENLAWRWTETLYKSVWLQDNGMFFFFCAPFSAGCCSVQVWASLAKVCARQARQILGEPVTLGSQMRVTILLWVATGMFASFMSGYSLSRFDEQRSREDLRAAYARISDLQRQSEDRRFLENELQHCTHLRRFEMKELEDTKWRMEFVANTCFGRVRTPRGVAVMNWTRKR